MFRFIQFRKFSSALPAFNTLKMQRSGPNDSILEISLNRPERSNAFSREMWGEIPKAFEFAGEDSCRVVILHGEGKNFTSGLDLADHQELISLGLYNPESKVDTARKGFSLMKLIKSYQASMSSVSAIDKPVIAVVHGYVWGAGIDLISNADIRIASQDALFSIKETEIGLAADVGTLQRFPKLIGNMSLFNQYVFTSENFTAVTARDDFGMLSSVKIDKAAAFAEAHRIASKIALLSPVAVQGSKANIRFSMDHTVSSGLQYATAWNTAMLQTEDLAVTAKSMLSKKPAAYKDL